jgi:MFS family permease
VIRGYRQLFALPIARRLTAALVGAWLSFGMIGLLVLLTVRMSTGSYRVGSLAVAGFSVGSAALAPLRGLTIDRRGVRRWLPLFAVGYASGLALLRGLERAHGPSWSLVLAATFAGASAPPLIASLRAAWTNAVEERFVRRGYAVTSIVGDAGLVLAPAFASFCVFWSADAATAVCIVPALAAALYVARVQGARSAETGTADEGRSLRLSGLFAQILVVAVAVGAASGALEVTVPIRATSWGATNVSGVLLGAFAAGSILGGAFFGARSWRGTAPQRYLVTTLVLALLLLLPPLAGSPAALAGLLVVAGLAFGPATVSLYETIDVVAPRSAATEALTWITTAEAVGMAGGAAGAGLLATTAGARYAFLAAAAVVAAPVGLALGSDLSRSFFHRS